MTRTNAGDEEEKELVTSVLSCMGSCTMILWYFVDSVKHELHFPTFFSFYNSMLALATEMFCMKLERKKCRLLDISRSYALSLNCQGQHWTHSFSWSHQCLQLTSILSPGPVQCTSIAKSTSISCRSPTSVPRLKFVRKTQTPVQRFQIVSSLVHIHLSLLMVWWT
jgi:hypothetical protein